jgi:hypothetical protein
LLLDTLETIKNMDIHVPRKPKKLVEKSGNKKQEMDSFKRSGNPNKWKKSDKFCDLCKKHGGAKTTRNTGVCRKYKKTELSRKNSRNPMVSPTISPMASIMQLLPNLSRK